MNPNSCDEAQTLWCFLSQVLSALKKWAGELVLRAEVADPRAKVGGQLIYLLAFIHTSLHSLSTPTLCP